MSQFENENNQNAERTQTGPENNGQNEKLKEVIDVENLSNVAEHFQDFYDWRSETTKDYFVKAKADNFADVPYNLNRFLDSGSVTGESIIDALNRELIINQRNLELANDDKRKAYYDKKIIGLQTTISFVLEKIISPVTPEELAKMNSDLAAEKKIAQKKPEKEVTEIPKKLFRGVTVNPEELSIERLKQDLVPGVVNKDDPTKINDGNELGVYTSTNEAMVTDAYSAGGRGCSSVEVPAYYTGYSMSTQIALPSCGIVYEINTDRLEVRKPEITSYLKLVHNNGFEGDEWIADKIPSKFYKVKKLILSRFSNDSEMLSVNVDGETDDDLQKAIDTVKNEFAKRKSDALKIKQELEVLSDEQRKNNFVIRDIFNLNK